ncbi:deoxycytidine deaminase [Clavibacter sp. VKM Ac-2872]|uniref:dCTP deaminase n=1 Tax=Clavibacter sp. VKM Ac-2872 TaxID=2783812 RepID=UPI00188D5672|nr:deoxycytidine deaminase [Clavibacter sp. VKM Ac-2872]MBF4625454.1 deoxycytidine deaminase [Clavibacter sp. VKM Ac-2872]
MILTGGEIQRQIRLKRIHFDPFDPRDVNPNSVNYHLGPVVKTTSAESLDSSLGNDWDEQTLPEAGMLFIPDTGYLAGTVETMGSNFYVPSLIGRSSLGRLGVFLQVSADLGNLGAIHKWTLEIVVTQPIRLYPGMECGQISFWEPMGDIHLYDGLMGRHDDPHQSIPEAMFSSSAAGNGS